MVEAPVTGLNDKPAGKAPEIVQPYGAVPPDAVHVAE
jgi:hypothetical protein